MEVERQVLEQEVIAGGGWEERLCGKLLPLRMEFFWGKENETKRCCGQEECRRLPEECVCVCLGKGNKARGTARET